MDKFGFIVHPVDIEQVITLWPKTKFLPKWLMGQLLKWYPPFELAHIRNVKSKTGKEIEGYFICCPLLPRQFLEFNEEFVLRKIVKACAIARKLGVKIIGLGGFTSVVGDQGKEVAKRFDIPLTTGNTYTVATVIEGVRRAAKVKGLRLSDATCAIIGATGSIGSTSSQILAKEVGRLIISARRIERLERLAKSLSGNKAKIEIEQDIRKAVQDADIVITTTSSPDTLIEPKDLKGGMIVCDVAVPKNVGQDFTERDNLFIFAGGVIKPPGEIDFGTNLDIFAKRLTYACIAETMILCFEDMEGTYSAKEDIRPDRADELFQLGRKHGFELVIEEEK